MKCAAILLAVLLFTAFLGAAPGRAGEGPRPHTLLLDYDDFGPQVIAHELIGMQWFQWDAHGDESRKEKIVVVVYSGQGKEAVSKQFPVNRATKQDYRYVSQKAALDFLDKQITALKGDRDIDGEVRAGLLKSLGGTRKKIEEFSKQK